MAQSERDRMSDIGEWKRLNAARSEDVHVP